MQVDPTIPVAGKPQLPPFPKGRRKFSILEDERIKISRKAKEIFGAYDGQVKESILKRAGKCVGRVFSTSLRCLSNMTSRIARFFNRYILRQETAADGVGDHHPSTKEKEEWLQDAIALFQDVSSDNVDLLHLYVDLKTSEAVDDSVLLPFLNSILTSLSECCVNLDKMAKCLDGKNCSTDKIQKKFNTLDKPVQLAIIAIVKGKNKVTGTDMDLFVQISQDKKLKKKVKQLLHRVATQTEKRKKQFQKIVNHPGVVAPEQPFEKSATAANHALMTGIVKGVLKKINESVKFVYDCSIEEVCPSIDPETLAPVKITMVGLEYSGLAKQGGLGEAVAGLAGGLASEEGRGNQVRLIFPEYSCLPLDIKEKLSQVEPQHYDLTDGEKVSFKTIEIEGGIECTFINHPLFELDKEKPDVYGPDFKTVGKRFATFSDLAAEIIHREKENIDVIHLHEAHTAGVALRLKRSHKEEWKAGDIPPVVFTFHNNSVGAQNRLLLGPYNYAPVIHEYVNAGILKKNENLFVKILKICDSVSTVSENFALESQQKQGGEGVSFAVKQAAKTGKLVGILNGIDIKHWNPETDATLANFQVSADADPVNLCFDIDNKQLFKQRKNAKKQLALWIEKYYPEMIKKGGGEGNSKVQPKVWDPEKPTMTYIGRYDSYQKGLALLPDAIEETLRQGGQFICMGSSEDPEATKILDKLEKKYANNNAVLIIRDYKTENGKYHWQQECSCGSLVRAATDVLFVPSTFEPCGLVQFEAWAFGSLVLGANVGGLADTISPIGHNNETGEWKGNGFTFDRRSNPKKAVNKAIQSTFKFYKDVSDEEKDSLMEHLITSGRAFGWTDSYHGLSTVTRYRILYENARQRVQLRGSGNTPPSEVSTRRIRLDSARIKNQAKSYPEEKYLKDYYYRKKGSTQLTEDYYKIDRDRRYQLPSPFGRGVDFQMHKRLGAFETSTTFEFHVNAKNADTVEINLYNRQEEFIRKLSLTKDESGVWHISVPKELVSQADKLLYRYEINGREKNDPLARMIVQSKDADATPYSAVQDDHFEWKDSSWMTTRDKVEGESKPISIYEMHPTTWKRKNGECLTYQQLGEEIVKHQKEVGFTHIELMGLCHHPNELSWGYQVTGYFAPNSRMGSPKDFKEMVNYLHENNIGVIMDWVPNHFAHDEDGLKKFDSSYTFEKRVDFNTAGMINFWNQWGHLFNYNRKNVREFLISSAHFWLEEMHIDGIRVDAVRSIIDRKTPMSKQFLRDLNAVVHREFPGVITMAEEYKGYKKVTHSPLLKGLGFDYKWHSGWAKLFLDFFSLPLEKRRCAYSKLINSITCDDFHHQMLVISHDHVAERAKTLIEKTRGIDEDKKFDNLRNALCLMMCLPGKKLFFMGAENGNSTPWDTFINGENGVLDGDNPAVAGEQKKTRDMLLWLNKFYQMTPAFNVQDYNSRDLDWIENKDPEKRVVAYRRKDKENNAYACFHNFTGEEDESYHVRVKIRAFNSESKPEGRIPPEVIFYSNDPNNETGTKPKLVFDSHNNCYQIQVPPLSTVIVKEGILSKDKK